MVTGWVAASPAPPGASKTTRDRSVAEPTTAAMCLPSGDQAGNAPELSADERTVDPPWASTIESEPSPPMSAIAPDEASCPTVPAEDAAPPALATGAGEPIALPDVGAAALGNSTPGVCDGAADWGPGPMPQAAAISAAALTPVSRRTRAGAAIDRRWAGTRRTSIGRRYASGSSRGCAPRAEGWRDIEPGLV